MLLPHAIPQGAVLLHAGMPKSGTTALQRAAAASRTELLEHGVRYPGDRYNHSVASFAVSGRRRTSSLVDTAKPFPETYWLRLLDEVRADPQRRVLISHEFFAEHPAQVCRRVVTELDREVRVVFTMRNQPSILGSTWQQYVKSGATRGYGWWLENVLVDETTDLNRSFRRRTDLAGAVEKWADVVGAEQVSVVVLDRSRPSLLTEAFEALLGLPARLLGDVELPGDLTNRSFTAGEVELVRRLNGALKHDSTPLTWPRFRELYRAGGLHGLLSRTPDEDEGSLVTPQWAVDAMVERSREQVVRLGGLGIEVVGDLESLAAPVDGVAELPPPPEMLPIAAASALAKGILTGATRLDERRVGEIEALRTSIAAAARASVTLADDLSLRRRVGESVRATEGYPTRLLALAILGRFARKLRRVLSGRTRRGDA